MHFRPVRIDTDLNRLHSELAEPSRLRLADQHGIGLELDAKSEGSRVFQDFKKILAQENLAAAESENENAGLGHLLEQVLDLGGGHLAVVVVIEIAVNALLVAAVGKIEVRAERHAQPLRPFPHLLHKRAHGRSCSFAGGIFAMGSSEINKMPCLPRSPASASPS